MWVLESCFEGSEVPFRKAVKPGGVYHFGRKAPAELILADKTVSKESATIKVGLRPVGEGREPPTLTIHAHKRLIRIIDQGDEEKWQADRDNFIGDVVQPDGMRLLGAGDTVVLTKSAPSVKLLWSPIILTVSTRFPKEDVEQRRAGLEAAGILIMRIKQVLPDTTHFVTPSILATVPLLHSLVLAVPVVTMAFVDEVARRASLAASDKDSLERRFALPEPKDYFPEERHVEELSYEEIKVAFAVAESRKTMLTGTTLLLMHAEGGIEKNLEQTIVPCKAAGARIVIEDASMLDSDDSLLRLLRRNKSEAQTYLASCGERASEAPDEGLVVVCAPVDLSSSWCTRLQQMTRRLNIAMPDQGNVAINKAIVLNDARKYLNVMTAPSHTLEFEEETLPPTAPRKPAVEESPPPSILLTGQTEEHVPSAQPRNDEVNDPPPSLAPLPSTAASTTGQASPRKPRRRAEMARRDPLEDIFGPSVSSTAAPSATDGDEGTGAPIPRSGARRRNGEAEYKRPRASETWRSIFESGGMAGEEVDEAEGGAVASTAPGDAQSRTKRFRQELDEADRLASRRDTQAENAAQRQGSAEVPRVSHGREKRQATSPPEGEDEPRERRRRPAGDVHEERTGEADEGLASVGQADEAARSPVVDGKEAQKRDGKGADTDAKFLQAMATSKRSKKGMDQFDRDFNLLRIVKPNGGGSSRASRIIADEDDPEYRAWEQMGPSDFDINAAGNFVQVDFVPLVYKRSDQERRERDQGQERLREEWGSKPNFKKFKSKSKQRGNREAVGMELDDGKDYGMGSSYARNAGVRGSETGQFDEENGEDSQGRESESLVRPPSKPGPGRTKGAIFEEPFSDEEDDGAHVAPPSTKARPGMGKERGRGSKRKRAVDTGLDADVDTDNGFDPPHRSTAPVQLSSDDDEEQASTFSGFRKRRRP